MIIETALGMANVDEIAAASPRNESLHFGVADYAASTRARTTAIGGPNPDYGVLTDKVEGEQRQYFWGDMWHYAIARMVVAARANGLRPVDGPFGDFSDPDGYKAQANRAAVLGCEGKWAIHPSQIDAGQRGVQPVGQGGRQGQAHPRGHGPGPEGGQGRRRPRRPAHRHRLDQAGRKPGAQGRADRRRRLKGGLSIILRDV